jgi:hypothetical protein
MTKRFTVERIRLDRGGYTSAGRYYGTGAPLFSVTDTETDRTTEVRASSAKAARQKVMEGVFGPPPKNPLQGEARVLSRALYTEVVKNMDHPKRDRALAMGFQSQIEGLAARVRAANPSDRAWPSYDKDMAQVDPESPYAFGKLHSASQMIAGAAERIR